MDEAIKELERVLEGWRAVEREQKGQLKQLAQDTIFGLDYAIATLKVKQLRDKE